MAPTTISIDTRVVASDRQVSARVADEAVILAFREGRYFGLDPVAARIWDRVRTPVVLADVLRTIVNEFNVDEDRASADMLAFVSDLHVHGLIDIVDHDED